jgi:hypothetical protein
MWAPESALRRAVGHVASLLINVAMNVATIGRSRFRWLRNLTRYRAAGAAPHSGAGPGLGVGQVLAADATHTHRPATRDNGPNPG